MFGSHIHNEHLVVSMEGEEDKDLKELMNAFSKVVEYKPFCKYILTLKKSNAPALPTYEWDKVDPNERFEELKNKPNISNLVRIQF